MGGQSNAWSNEPHVSTGKALGGGLLLPAWLKTSLKEIWRGTVSEVIRAI